MPTRHQTAESGAQAALFIDYDNLHHVISAQNPGDQYPDEYAAEIFDELRYYLRDRAGLQLTIERAYADFGALDGDGQFVQRALHFDGIEPRFVSSALQKNASELTLCIDATDAVVQRGDLSMVVVLTGNRAYLPLARRLAEYGCQLLVASIFPPQEDDVPRFAQDDLFMDARSLLSDASRRALLNGDYEPSDEQVPYRKNKPSPEEYAELDDPMIQRTIEITEDYFGQYDEVYLTPLLRKLSDVLGPKHDPKALISDLEEAGAVRLEKRNGYPHDYTVLIVHDDHPNVRHVRNGTYSATPPKNGYRDAEIDHAESDHAEGEYHDDEHEEDDYGPHGSSESDGTPKPVSDTAYDDSDQPLGDEDN